MKDDDMSHFEHMLVAHLEGLLSMVCQGNNQGILVKFRSKNQVG